MSFESLYKKIFLYLLIIILTVWQLKAQALRLRAINHTEQPKTLNERRLAQAADTISLPFWDDFSAVRQIADTTLWQSSASVYINNGLAYLPPSFNVATLDGFDASGTSYATDSRQRGIGDSLVSQAIDLSTKTLFDNINISFFWQEGFGPTAPDTEDSLRLYFKNDSSEWELIYSRGGTGNATPVLFQQHFEQVNEPQFFHSGFQFKFEYFGNLSGDFDSWNLDYIYLNDGNTSVTTINFAYDSYEDRTFSAIPKNLFSDFYGVPLSHLTENWLNDNISNGTLIYNNLWAGDGFSPFFGTEIFGIISDTASANFLIDSLTLQGNFLTAAQDTAQFTAHINNPQKVIDYLMSSKDNVDSAYLETQFNLGNVDSLFFETINGVTVFYPDYSFQSNDTISQITAFHDYYALDDGTAEASIQLNSKNYQLAQEFNINGGHFLTALDFYVPNLAQNNGSKNITLLVLDSLNSQNPANDVIFAQNVLISPSSGLNEFQRFTFDSPVFVEGDIYVGYREENDEVVSIGFDKNSNSATELFYNQTGTWEINNTLVGSVMIRPVFGDISGIVSNKIESKVEPFKIWPNPNKGILYVSEDYDILKIYSLNGRLIGSYKDGLQDSSIHMPPTQDGLYIVQIYRDGKMQNFKLLLER